MTPYLNCLSEGLQHAMYRQTLSERKNSQIFIFLPPFSIGSTLTREIFLLRVDPIKREQILSCRVYPVLEGPHYQRSKQEVPLKNGTLKCLSIGTPKTINFPFVSNGKIMVFRCPNIQAHYNEAVIYLNFGTPKNNEFSIWNKWKINYFRCPNT